MVRIGHASISEKGTVNGVKGDQTGKEVCTRYYYDRHWDAVLRPVSAELAEKSAQACESGCANKNIGYGQADRNSLYREACKVGHNLKKISKHVNTDCSAFMTECAIAGGCTELNYRDNAPTTSNMIEKFVSTGKYKKITDKAYLSGTSLLKRGDVLVAKGHHTVMVLDNGSAVGKTSNKGKSKKYRVSISNLRVRAGAGTNYAFTGKYCTVGTVEIVETKRGKGSAKGWGKLASGGWIALDYAKMV